MITARDELEQVIATFSEAEAEQALDALRDAGLLPLTTWELAGGPVEEGYREAEEPSGECDLDQEYPW